MRKMTLDDIVTKGVSINSNWQKPSLSLGTDPCKVFKGQIVSFEGIDWHYVGNATEPVAQTLEAELQQQNPGIEVMYGVGTTIYVSDLMAVTSARQILEK